MDRNNSSYIIGGWKSVLSDIFIRQYSINILGLTLVEADVYI